MRSACLDQYQYAVGRHYDLFLLGRNRWILVLTQGFLDLLLDLQQGCVQRGGLCGDFGEVRNMGGAAVRGYHHARTAQGLGYAPEMCMWMTTCYASKTRLPPKR